MIQTLTSLLTVQTRARSRISCGPLWLASCFSTCEKRGVRVLMRRMPRNAMCCDVAFHQRSMSEISSSLAWSFLP